MAAPQVAATGAMMRVLNPYATLQDILRTIKRTAQRPRGKGWSSDLGWGILNAGAALEAIRRVDRLAPVSTLTVPKTTRTRTFTLRWTGRDQTRPGLIASGLASFALYEQTGRARARLVTRTRSHSWRFTGQSGHRYVFWLVAVDRAGNRQPRPVHHAVVVNPPVALTGGHASTTGGGSVSG
jgi:hypothetical protein